jgi:hypothetical protein
MLSDVAKVGRDVAHVAMVLHDVSSIYSKCFIYFFRCMLQVCLFGCCIYFTYMLQVFYLYVVYVFNCFFKCFHVFFVIV